MAEPERLSPEDQHVMDRLRSLSPDDFTLTPPPPSVWQGITAGFVSEPAVQPPARDRRRSRLVLVVAAAAIIPIAVGVGVVVGDTDDSSVRAAATLSSDGLEGAPPGRTAEARVVDAPEGQVLEVDLGGTRPGSGEYLELWLIKPDISGMVSLGAVRSDGTYDLPVGLEVGDYPVVDVSTEPYDGNPAHSGASLLRGVLDQPT